MSRFHSTKQSFGYAGSGLKEALQKEPNLQIHTAMGLAALVLGVLLGLQIYEWALLFFAIFFVFITELINTSLESIVNIVSPKIHPMAKAAKDVAAAAVLLAAFQSIIIGALLFIPRIAERLF